MLLKGLSTAPYGLHQRMALSCHYVNVGHMIVVYWVDLIYDHLLTNSLQ